LERAIKNNQNVIWTGADVFCNRGSSYAKLNRFTEAVSDYEEALQLSPDQETVLNRAAWFLATVPNDNVRDGKRAVELACKACELTKYANPAYVDTLATAYAAAGDFESAVKWCQKSIELTKSDKSRAEFSQHLDSYRAGKPWRE
jgi:tetratricopeptide (TPR) repeat protein